MLDVKENVTDPSSPDQPVPLSENARTVLTKRYLRRGPDGKPVETPEGMFHRVAHAIALPEQDHGDDVATAESAFYRLLTQLRFFPNSPTFTGAGTPLGQLAACFVLAISDDMGRRSDGIFQTLRDAALIQQTGGGNGFSFSHLRPQGAFVASSAGQATGRNEVPSKMVGDMVIAGLKQLDQVAYIRYATVYLGLADLEAVRREIDRILER